MLLLLSLPILLLGAALALGLRSNRASGAVAIGSQVLGCACVLADVVPLLAGQRTLALDLPWPAPIGMIAFRVDALAAFFLVWSLPITLLGTIYAIGYLQPYFARGRRGGSHFALLNLVAASFVLIYSVQNALVFLLGWEIAAVAAWLLVIWDYESQKIRFAGFNYLVSTHVGLFVLVAAFMLLHSRVDSMDFQRFGEFLARPSSMRASIFLLLGTAFALKAAFFPFHTWLPRAHAAAPAHVSALMSGVIHKAGLFGFLRFTLLMGRPDEWMGWSVLGFGALSALFGVLYASVQRDMKRLLGYSSTENVGIAAMGFGVGYLGWAWGLPGLSALGFAGGLLHVLNHAVFKCLLFYAAGSVYRSAHTVDIERLGGLAKRLPRTASLFLVGGLAISGLPPLNGFVSEFIIYCGLLGGAAPSSEGNMVFVAAAAVLALVGAASALAMTRAFGIAFLGTPRDARVQVDAEAPAAMWGPMLVHAGAAVAIGVAPGWALACVQGALQELAPGSEIALALAPLEALVWANRLLAVSVLGLGLLRLWLGASARRSATWGCGYTALSPRMQYTGSAFSEQLGRVFAAFVPAVRRETLPRGAFPRGRGALGTYYADAVERRLFEVIGRGEGFLARASERIPEQPQFAFAAGLVMLILIGAFVLGAGP